LIKVEIIALYIIIFTLPMSRREEVIAVEKAIGIKVSRIICRYRCPSATISGAC